MPLPPKDASERAEATARSGKKDCGPEDLKIHTVFGVRMVPIIHLSRQISKAGPEAYEESRRRGRI
ncbi:hypothetical protein EDF68_1372 [Ochrobactrum sp. BH3]|nr:hypothetical protein EDF68_1372 [Ochrobactrum sp. BH3]